MCSPIFAGGKISYVADVIDVVDGDSFCITNRISGKISMRAETPVKLDGVDAPEIEQPGGQESRDYLVALLQGKRISVVEIVDRGVSKGAWVFVGDEKKSVNVLLVEEGKAWLTEPRLTSDSKAKREHMKMKDAFQKAKEQKKGIWAEENPIPPWEWREKHPKKDEAQPEE